MFLMFFFSQLSFAGAISASNVQIRLTPPVSKTTAMFLTLKNSSDKEVKLKKVSGDLSDNIELHDMIMENNSMKMRAVTEIKVPQKGEVILKSGSLHVMIFDIKKELKENDKHKFKLTFDNGENLEIEASVKDFNK